MSAASRRMLRGTSREDRPTRTSIWIVSPFGAYFEWIWLRRASISGYSSRIWLKGCTASPML